jgi:hypothetical protein
VISLALGEKPRSAESSVGSEWPKLGIMAPGCEDPLLQNSRKAGGGIGDQVVVVLMSTLSSVENRRCYGPVFDVDGLESIVGTPRDEGHRASAVRESRSEVSSNPTGTDHRNSHVVPRFHLCPVSVNPNLNVDVDQSASVEEVLVRVGSTLRFRVWRRPCRS